MRPHDPTRKAIAVMMFLALVRKIDALILCSVAEDGNRILPSLDLLDLARQHLAVKRDALIRAAEMLIGAVGDRDLA